jgi:hypothetical protein
VWGNVLKATRPAPTLDQLQTRLEALEQQARTVARQLRWWRGVACGLLVLAVLTWALPSSTAQEDTRGGQRGLAQRVAALEQLLKHFSRRGNQVFITGANLHIVNGLEATDTTNGLGNLIVGYNEPRGEEEGQNIRTGSHNVVVGQRHNFSRFGGLVVGFRNEISGDFASVSGGFNITAITACACKLCTLLNHHIAHDVALLGACHIGLGVCLIVDLHVDALQIPLFPPYVEWAPSATGLDIRKKHRGISKEFLKRQPRKLFPSDPCGTVHLKGKAVKASRRRFPGDVCDGLQGVEAGRQRLRLQPELQSLLADKHRPTRHSHGFLNIGERCYHHRRHPKWLAEGDRILGICRVDIYSPAFHRGAIR